MASTANLRIVGEGESALFDPTSSDNSSFTLTWDGGGHLTEIYKIVGAFNYKKTLTWVGDNLTVISAWVEV